MEKCPFCGVAHEMADIEYGKSYECQKVAKFNVEDECFGEHLSPVENKRRASVIHSFLLSKPYFVRDYCNFNWFFYYDEKDITQKQNAYVNVFNLLKDYPKTLADRIDKILLNLSMRFPILTDEFSKYDLYFHSSSIYCESDNAEAETETLISFLLNRKYLEEKLIEKRGDLPITKYRISYLGWERIDYLKKNSMTKNQGFIAIRFADTDIINAIKVAINNSGYSPMILNDKEHNNYIMPEIFHEIENSRFLVIDVTYPNYGAYFEAGYALALGKEVIVCCRQAEFDDHDRKPHFDIAQKSTIKWENEKDLIEKLTRRIEVTVK